MKLLRLLNLILCGYLVAFGVGGLFLPEVKNGHRNITLDRTETMQYRLANGKYFLPVGQDHRTPFRPYTPPRWIRERAAYDAAHPRIRRIENGRVYTVGWKQTGVVYKGEVFDLEGRRMGCL